MVFAQLLSSNMAGQLMSVAVGLYGVLVPDESAHSRDDQNEAVSGVHGSFPSISWAIWLAKKPILRFVPVTRWAMACRASSVSSKVVDLPPHD
jgi:hypothetical protein